MAQAAAQGVSTDTETPNRVIILHADDVNDTDMLGALGYIFVFPERLAAISGPMKSFFDRNYYPCLGQIEARPYAMMICAGSDGENALRQGMRICQGWRLKPVQKAIIIKTYAQTNEEILAPKTISKGDLQKCYDLGALLTNGLSMGIF